MMLKMISPRRLPSRDADLPEILVPIRLEIDVDQHKFKETFLWNLNGEFIKNSGCLRVSKF
jgi:SWI/SNF-related matrix-associated actin-dependent regulator of chromatin subfamily B member 1